MPLVRVHESSDGQLFKEYDDYVKHEEAIKFASAWENTFPPEFDEHKKFVIDNADKLVEVILQSKVKRAGNSKRTGNKK